MLEIIDIQAMNHVSLRLVSLLTMTFIKGFFVFAVMYFTILRMKKLSAEFRHLLWFFVICSFIILPFASFIIPSFDLQVLRVPAEMEEVHRVFDSRLSPQLNYTAQTGMSLGVVSGVSESYTLSGLHWTAVVLMVWIFGTLISLLRIIVGKMGLLCLTRKAALSKDKNCVSMLRRLSEEMGISQEIELRESSRCLTPFTCNVFRPVILLPSSIGGWSRERLRVVLIHELAHIRRRDYLTQNISRVACAIFWFIPMLWVAYGKLQVEQERACDRWVINSGAEPADYADHIVEIVRYTRGHIVLAGIPGAVGRRHLLEKRVRDILSFRRDNMRYKVRHVGRIFMICTLCLLPLLLINPVTAEDSKSLIKNEASVEEIYGRWINTDYGENRGNCGINAKMVVKKDKIHLYSTFNSPEYSYSGRQGPYIIADSWVDRKGNSWYKVRWSHLRGDFYQLWKVSNSGMTLELASRAFEYPTEIETNSYRVTYRIYYRQDVI